VWIKIVLNTFMVKNDNICQYMKLSGDFNAYCCHIRTDIKHRVSDRVKPSFVIFDIWALTCRPE